MGAYTAAIRATYAGQTIVNTIGVTTVADSAEDAAQAAYVAQRVGDLWASNVLPALVSGYRMNSVQVRGASNPELVAEYAKDASGGITAEAGLPGFAVVKVRFLTNTLGRAGKGRTGLSGAGEGATPGTDPNSLQGVSVTAYQNAMNGLQSGLQGSAPVLRLAVISKYKGVDPATRKPIPRPTPLVSQVHTISIDSRLGTRISRLR